MHLRHAAVAVLALSLAACSESTSPNTQGNVVTDAPKIGTTVTIAGASGLASVGLTAISGAVTGNPYALATAGSTVLPPPPTCTPGTNGITSCAITVNGLNIAYTFGWRDSLGLRTETQISGTIPAQASLPARRVSRQAVSWMLPLSGGSSSGIAIRHRSNESGTHEQIATPRVVSTDTGSADLRVVIGPFASGELRIPRMVGSSRRVIWTRRDNGPATFWRETTTYDSSSVIHSVIETPTGTRNCSIDLAASVIALTCR
jgi:hypothetical protein